jgi:hypothetical protein
MPFVRHAPSSPDYDFRGQAYSGTHVRIPWIAAFLPAGRHGAGMTAFSQSAVYTHILFVVLAVPEKNAPGPSGLSEA